MGDLESKLGLRLKDLKRPQAFVWVWKQGKDHTNYNKQFIFGQKCNPFGWNHESGVRGKTTTVCSSLIQVQY
jgi:hypothetical protein